MQLKRLYRCTPCSRQAKPMSPGLENLSPFCELDSTWSEHEKVEEPNGDIATCFPMTVRPKEYFLKKLKVLHGFCMASRSVAKTLSLEQTIRRIHFSASGRSSRASVQHIKKLIGVQLT